TRANASFQHPVPDFGNTLAPVGPKEISRRFPQMTDGGIPKLRVIHPGVTQIAVLIEDRDGRVLERHTEAFFAETHGLFSALTLSDVFGEEHQPSDNARAVVPRQNFPTNPLGGSVGALEVIVFFAQDFSAQAATMSFSPSLGNRWKDFI